MDSRTQRRRSGAWWTTPIAALCPALAVLFTALVMCLGFVAHDSGEQATAPMTTMAAAPLPADAPDQHQAMPAAHPADCPFGSACCDPAIHDVRAVMALPAQPVPAVLPRMPDLPRPDAPSSSGVLDPPGSDPDLHVLQVQRT
ncbi:hypothetical protein ACWGQ5_28845 [Streptomyces sp. NPDC055722]